MKKTLSILLSMLLLYAGVGFASEALEALEMQEIDLSILLEMPDFEMQYNEDDEPLWFSYEHQYRLSDDNGCYVIPCVTALETGIGDFLVLQLDVGHYAAAQDMIDITAFSILVDESEYTFEAPRILGGKTEEYGMILCGHDAVDMLEKIAATSSPVHVVLQGNKGNYAFMMTDVQRSAIVAMIEGCRRAGVFSSDMVLDIAQNYTAATVSTISAENKSAVDNMGKQKKAKPDHNEEPLQEDALVDFSVFEALEGFTVKMDETKENIAVYSTDASHLYTKEGYFFEPLIGSIMGGMGYAPILSLSFEVDETFVIHKAAFVSKNSRYTFSPTEISNMELSSIFRILCGEQALNMVISMLEGNEIFEVELVGEDETIVLSPTDEQLHALKALYDAYVESGAAAHQPTLDIAQELSPVLVKMYTEAILSAPAILPAPTTKPTTDRDLPVDRAPFEDLDGIVIEKNDETGQYRFVFGNPVELLGDAYCALDPYVTTMTDEHTGNTVLSFMIAATYHKESSGIYNPKRLRFIVDDIQYTIFGGTPYDTDTLVSIAAPCGADALSMIDKIIHSKKPVTAVIVCSDVNIEFVLTEKQTEVLASLYDAYMRTDDSKNEALLARFDEEARVHDMEVSLAQRAADGPIIELDSGEVIENKSFIVHSADADTTEHYADNGCFMEPVFVYDAEDEKNSTYYALAIGQDQAKAAPEKIIITVGENAYAFNIAPTKGFLHLDYALIPIGQEKSDMIDALLRAEEPSTVTLITQAESVEFTVTENQIELLQLLREE